ncbi:hypothetical protein E1I69_09110 [Bacillus timonensis]|uniref:Uncharacterized protein n=1 Tax=Bacillus timonensis TaxID=1033734 RepID=A0A4S3PTD9_9BACI|nr:hypothetical protein [Bacillus timonensis]THE13021.1 hypothetical protein E1I69_09110 [Bacillus timonensis]
MMNDFRQIRNVRQPFLPWYYGFTYFLNGGFPPYGSGYLYPPSFQQISPLSNISVVIPSVGGHPVGAYHGAHGFVGSHGFHGGGGIHGFHGGGFAGGGIHGRSF